MRAVERLRQIWTPQSEVAELFADLDPRTELDSMIRDFLHRTIQTNGPTTLLLEIEGQPVLNTGTLRWEVIHYEPSPGIPGRREVSLWVEA